jgi:cytochrome c5
MRRILLALLLAAAGAHAHDHKERPGTRSGETVYLSTCAACHKDGVAGAPKVGDRVRWAPLIREGLKELTEDSIKGKGAMPPRGGDASLTRAELSRAIAYMANRSGATWKEPK